jgi:hypothetical protein
MVYTILAQLLAGNKSPTVKSNKNQPIVRRMIRFAMPKTPCTPLLEVAHTYVYRAQAYVEVSAAQQVTTLREQLEGVFRDKNYYLSTKAKKTVSRQKRSKIKI